MSIPTIIFIALGLSMDALAVSVASGFSVGQASRLSKTTTGETPVLPDAMKIGHAVRIALFFGGFQLIMPILGWLAGSGLQKFIAGFDHWVAFGLLSFIGGKMIYESTKMAEREKIDPLKLHVLLVLAVATSIDALAVGLSLSFLNVAIIMPSVIIGVVTFAVSFIGVYVGRKFGHFFESRLEVAGGLILIAIGIKILIEHTVSS